MKLTCVTAVWNAIAAGNREKLVRCAKSVAALRIPHEHLFMDGASTDGTLELLCELEKEVPGLKVMSSKDTGIYNALNKGLKAATGEWFYVLGCDDYLCAPAVMDGLLAEDDPVTQVIIAPVEYDGDPNYSFHRMSDLKNLMFWGYGYCHQGVLLKTDLARKFGGFDERYRYCADGDLMLRIHLACAKFRYTFVPYANFAAGGANEQFREKVRAETIDFLGRNLGMTPAEADRANRLEVPPLWLGRKFLFSRDVALRKSARHIFRVRLGNLKHAIRVSLNPILGEKKT